MMQKRLLSIKMKEKYKFQLLFIKISCDNQYFYVKSL